MAKHEEANAVAAVKTAPSIVTESIAFAAKSAGDSRMDSPAVNTFQEFADYIIGGYKLSITHITHDGKLQKLDAPKVVTVKARSEAAVNMLVRQIWKIVNRQEGKKALTVGVPDLGKADIADLQREIAKRQATIEKLA